MIKLLTPENGATVTQLSERHLEYIREPKNDPTERIDWLNLKNTGRDYSYPVPVRFAFSPAVSGELVLRGPDGERIIPAENGCAEANNLRIGETYTWFVRTDADASPAYTFRTDPQPPRLLYVDGITNVRDFGGFRTADGGRIRQGMIYRTSELDTHVTVTPDGMRTLTDELGVRCDLDLRGIKDEPRCPILDQSRVKWLNYPLAAYADCFTDEQLRLYGESFRILTDESLYPMICHCWGGIDRTGTWLYILGAMLGVSEDDLGLDYEFSSFSRWNRRSRRSDQFTEFLTGLCRFGGTMQEKGTGYMKAAGVSDAELEIIRRLLLEEGRA
ncbi:MAG: tyrosine-protein phosphatase [Oscillospiraceae bacterium]|nr:tyrosine-protein phosphatase [Oscillospiraceae bacterium]